MKIITPDDSWKRAMLPNHKFDFLNLEDFEIDKTTTRIGYAFVFLKTLKSILVYCADLGNH
jgi:hypothetical protein